MNLDDAIKSHSDWKLTLRKAMIGKEQLDAKAIGTDNACPFGKWLHSEARTKYGGLKSYAACVERHKLFHIEAGKVAQAVNAGKYTEATAMLDGGTTYSAASSSVAGAILGLRKEANI